MAAKALRIIQDSKHVGTVSREQIDKVIRDIEMEHSARKHESVSNSPRPNNGDASTKH